MSERLLGMIFDLALSLMARTLPVYASEVAVTLESGLDYGLTTVLSEVASHTFEVQHQVISTILRHEIQAKQNA